MAARAQDKSLNPRQTAIARRVEQEGHATIDELVAAFEVTPQTIRRDLTILADSGLIARFHGGASPVNSTENLPYQDRRILNQTAKGRIAAVVAAQIPDHASLFINIGTTTETIARALLQHRGLQVVTNNLHVAAILSPKEDFRVIVASGEVRARDGGIVGEATLDFIRQFKLDYGIIGISGIEEDGALLDYDYREVRVAQTIMEQSRQVLLAADHSKFGRRAMVRLGHITQADVFVTDVAPPEAIAEQLSAAEVRLIVAGDA
ncbi:DeoR family transcriptional regulator [Saccharospirillum mangrovi]|uniref:DeoR family transcriptional regulator n=1 Tax=Saccharospirillum mangrovi TaxID=2161747 RepID=UPI000D3B4BF9|nr:DeoR family transcriptional regulator [Saccharospirillum mangrovi]